jgi:hypothetical protein
MTADLLEIARRLDAEYRPITTRDLAAIYTELAAIIAAVNNGTLDPIVPEGAQVILPGVTYALGDPDELAELRALRERIDECRIEDREVTIGRGRTHDACALLHYLRH